MKTLKLLFLILGLIIGMFIFYVSSMSFPLGDQQTGGFNFFPLLYHAGIFFFFGMFLFLSVFIFQKNKIGIFLVFFISVIYAILDELHQYYIPGRAATLFDVFIDIIGIVVALIFVSLIFIFKDRIGIK